MSFVSEISTSRTYQFLSFYIFLPFFHFPPSFTNLFVLSLFFSFMLTFHFLSFLSSSIFLLNFLLFYPFFLHTLSSFPPSSFSFVLLYNVALNLALYFPSLFYCFYLSSFTSSLPLYTSLFIHICRCSFISFLFPVFHSTSSFFVLLHLHIYLFLPGVLFPSLSFFIAHSLLASFTYYI